MSVHDEAHDLCADCGMPATTDERPCYCDCDHADVDDHATCLTCGRDCYEDLAAAAYDAAKGSRYED